MNYEQKYKEALEKARQLCAYPTTKPFISDLQELFPELKENEDEKIRKAIYNALKYLETVQSWDFLDINISDAYAWLEKQSESNPYSGVSFKYNGHTYGMCARDNGVEVLLDGKIKQRVFLDKIQALREMVNNAKKVEPKFHEGEWITIKE